MNLSLKCLVLVVGVLVFLHSGVRADLIAHYTFDDGDATDVEQDNDGTPEGDAVSDGPGVGPDGEAFRFSGQGHIVIPIDINPSIYPQLTVTMWVKADESIPQAPALYKTFGHDDGGWDRTFGLDNRNGEFRWAAFNGNGITQTTGTPVTSEWTFLAAVWDRFADGGPVVRFHAGESYIEEALTETSSGHTTAAIGNLRPDNFNEGWRGLIDEVQIYDEALEIDEIDEIREEIPPPDAAAPEVITRSGTGFGDGTATLRGGVDPNGLATMAHFEYGLTVNYGMVTPDVDVGNGFGAMPVTAMLEGLDIGATYHFRVVGTNSLGTTMGEDMTFVVPEPALPIAYYSFDDEVPDDDTGNGHDGFVDGDAMPFEPGVGDDGGAFQFFGQGQIEIPIDINSSVYPNMTVTMWVKADEALTQAPGLYKTFGHDDGGYDRVFGLDNRNGPFRWGAFTGAGITQTTGTPVTPDWTFLAVVWTVPESGNATVRFHANENYVVEPLADTVGQLTAAIGSLRPDNFNEGFQGLIDEVRIFDAALSVGEIEAIRAEFAEEQPGVPEVTTLAPSGIGVGTATLRGRVNPTGLATTAWFEYGLTTAYGMTTPEVDIAAGFNSVAVTAMLDTLEPQQTYHYRLAARNAMGTSEGEDQSFLVPDLQELLVAHYTFEGGEALDVSGNDHHGIVEGDALPADSDRDGDEDGEAFQFFGGGHIVVPIDINPSVYPDLTVTMWVKADELLPDSPGLYKSFGHDDGGWDRTFGLDQRSPDGDFRWAAFTGGAGPGPTQNTGAPVTEEWTFLAAVWDTGENGEATVRFHVDDTQVSEPLINTTGQPTAAIGNLRPDNFSEGWVGLIDDVRIYSAALTEDQIEDIREGATGPQAPFLLSGNVNGDGAYNISDPVAHLSFLFASGPLPDCYVVPGSEPVVLTETGLAILDFNGDGASNLADAVASLNALFGGGDPPALGDGCVEIPGSTCSDQCQ